MSQDVSVVNITVVKRTSLLYSFIWATLSYFHSKPVDLLLILFCLEEALKSNMSEAAVLSISYHHSPTPFHLTACFVGLCLKYSNSRVLLNHEKPQCKSTVYKDVQCL
jgi:hypothetical protein